MRTTLQLQPGKRVCQRRTEVNLAGNINSAHLIRIYDPVTMFNFLLDTGSSASLVPKCLVSPKTLASTPDRFLYAANGSAIPVFGEISLTVSLQLRRSFTWIFVIADVTQPILGIDFLSHFDLTIDTKQGTLRDNLSSISTLGLSTTTQVHGISHMPKSDSVHPTFKWIQKDFPDLLKPVSTLSPVKHNVQHHIITKGPPVFAKPRRLPPEKLKVAKAQFQQMLDLGLIRPSDSPYASPLHLVPKKTHGDFRPTGDYRRLNAQTVVDRYPIPYIFDFTAHLNGMTVFSKLDLCQSYMQIPMHPDSIPATAIITTFGKFEYLRMGFGMRNASQTFQRFMDDLLRDLPFCFVFIDDILIASPDGDAHHSHLNTVFKRLNDAGLRINPDKCVFSVPKLDFLGHTISAEGIQPLQEKVSAIRNFPQPDSQTQLRKFLGMVNYYLRFIEHGADILRPLNALLRPKAKKSTAKVEWNEEATTAFLDIKNKIADTTLLTHPIHDAPTRLTTDASCTAVGGILQQKQNNVWLPLAFFSKKLQPAETRYSTFSRELLAMYLSIKHFRYFLQGRDFSIYTDHKPLTHAITSYSDRHSPRESRHLEFVAQFTTDIRYIKGTDNNQADALSRVEINNISDITRIDFEEMSKAQALEDVTTLQDTSLDPKWINIPGIQS